MSAAEAGDGDANKLLARADDERIVTRSVRMYLDAVVDPVVIVVGHEANRVRAALPEAVRVVHNPDYADGQASSVRIGIGALPDDVDAAVVGLGDMPFVRPETVTLLARAFHAGAGDPLAAAFDGRRGNPVCFGRQWFDALRDVRGDTGGRELPLTAPDAALVETADPGVRRDIDQPSDLPSE
ncbi:nucleotidyltransferase family protein [Haloplanus aerogenes]|uniref:Molybdenum cofactor cytidylyltransferase n=2 Tax=Haloplanus aerogenes TaxID=660522 RepID=A0A3M0DF13_9EURY|nr:nucleotidyltransferase family protein [Haloplanus aerogenes]RMB18059.1 molybdenum cofactor cytidylyltransferase [Haloplanus aerogenes]